MAEALSAVGFFWATWSWLLFVVVLVALVAVGVDWWRRRAAAGVAETEHARAVAGLQNELNEQRAALDRSDQTNQEALARLAAELAATRNALVVRGARSIAR